MKEKGPLIKLIVIDSISFHFRHDIDDMGLRTRLLNSMAQSLMALAFHHSVAVCSQFILIEE